MMIRLGRSVWLGALSGQQVKLVLDKPVAYNGYDRCLIIEHSGVKYKLLLTLESYQTLWYTTEEK